MVLTKSDSQCYQMTTVDKTDFSSTVFRYEAIQLRELYRTVLVRGFLDSTYSIKTSIFGMLYRHVSYSCWQHSQYSTIFHISFNGWLKTCMMLPPNNFLSMRRTDTYNKTTQICLPDFPYIIFIYQDASNAHPYFRSACTLPYTITLLAVHCPFSHHPNRLQNHTGNWSKTYQAFKGLVKESWKWKSGKGGRQVTKGEMLTRTSCSTILWLCIQFRAVNNWPLSAGFYHINQTQHYLNMAKAASGKQRKEKSTSGIWNPSRSSLNFFQLLCRLSEVSSWDLDITFRMQTRAELWIHEYKGTTMFLCPSNSCYIICSVAINMMCLQSYLL